MAEEKYARDKELVLAPGQYAYTQDLTKGTIKTFVGPTVINQTGQELPVAYNPKNGTFERCHSLDQAVRKSPIAVEGYYLVLLNPSKEGDHPEKGTKDRVAPDLSVGRRVNIPGPTMFALWPGQAAEHIRGHHLRSNQYLLGRVYNEEEARKNWDKAVVKLATDGDTPSNVKQVIDKPADLSVGKLFVIKGTEVSFYIPPTGISVIPSNIDEVKEDEDEARISNRYYSTKYVRNALTLERLEYCILVDENGNKRYEKGPQVVFPQPTEVFVSDDKGRRKFRAIELNEIQGLHIKVIANYTDETGSYKEGDELFITGKQTAIYYPRQEHSLISYDGKSKHFATAVPAGEARYIMNRMTGEIKTAKGPAMLLPDPRNEVVVRRTLSDKESKLWYPGNTEAAEYNRILRSIVAKSPTTRSGVVSEGDYARTVTRGSTGSSGSSGPQGLVGGEKARGGFKAKMQANALVAAVMDQSILGDPGSFMADEFTRAANYSEPRMITLDTKYHGVPSVDVWTGYAVMLVSKLGTRKVMVGPTTVLLNYDETLESMSLSTGKPKNTESVLETVYLRVSNNKISDIIEVETLDHVLVNTKISLKVDFEGDSNKWFDVENYVKFLCDHVRSVLKGAVKKFSIRDFYNNPTDIIRDIILGVSPEKGSSRPGMVFTENGMRVVDVEVLAVAIADPVISTLLTGSQQNIVKSNIELLNAKHNLGVTLEMEKVKQQQMAAELETNTLRYETECKRFSAELEMQKSKADGQIEMEGKRKENEEAKQSLANFVFSQEVARTKSKADIDEAIARAVSERETTVLQKQTESIVSRFSAVQPGFSESLLALSNNDTVVKVAEAVSVQKLIGGQSFTDAISKIFEGTPLKPIMDHITKPQHTVPSNGGKDKPTVRVP